MQVRLAFSIAIKAQGDILVLDEVLAVGDEAFQRKCNDFFNKIKKDKDKTVILVTHSMESMKRFCTKAIMIDDGLIIASGSTDDVSNMYKISNFRKKNKIKDSRKEIENSEMITDFRIDLMSPEVISQNDKIEFKVSYEVNKKRGFTKSKISQAVDN